MEEQIQNQVSLILGKYGWLFIVGVLTLLFRGTIEKFVSGLFGRNFAVVDNSKFMDPEDAQKKFGMITKKYIDKFIKRPIKNPKGKKWVKNNLKLKAGKK